MSDGKRIELPEIEGVKLGAHGVESNIQESGSPTTGSHAIGADSHASGADAAAHTDGDAGKRKKLIIVIAIVAVLAVVVGVFVVVAGQGSGGIGGFLKANDKTAQVQGKDGKAKSDSKKSGVTDQPIGDVTEEGGADGSGSSDSGNPSGGGTSTTPGEMAGMSLADQYQAYKEMSGEAQRIFYESFASPADYFAWFNSAKAAYEEAHPPIIIDE